MTATPSRSNNSIDSLARLLASENISVQHQPVPTAAFDTLSRTLILPIFEDMTQEVYDMLVGHEVGHALFTPAGEVELLDALTRINYETGANQGLAKTALNIIEDARIERMMKDKYPGLRRDFVRGYQWLHGRDFFGIADVAVEDLSILDRLNLHYKLGTINISIPFNAIEKVFVTKIDAIRTWEDVVEVAIEVLSFYKDNRPEENEQSDSGQPQESNQPGDEPEGPQGDDGQPSSAGDDGFDDDETDSDDESGTGAGDAASDDGEDVGDDNGDESGEDSGASMEDDTDDGESAESTAGEMQAGDGNEAGESLVNEGGWGNELDSKTSDSLADNLAKQANTEVNNRAYVKNPKMILDNIIVDRDTINSYWQRTNVNWSGADALRKSWERINQPVINNMCKQFEMKKSADNARRTFSSKTGRLDMNRLHAYKTSDDIFLSAESTRDGKNHGLVMFIDWSGSMCDNLAGTISQMLNLVYFCKKSNVPFEVYAFSSVIGNEYCYHLSDAEQKEQEKQENLPMNESTDDVTVGKFRLLNFFKNGMKTKDFNESVNQMMILMASHLGRSDSEEMFNMEQYAMYASIRDDSKKGQMVPRAIGLGCTPLNECILAAKDIVNDFKNRNNVQICNAVFLTDGDSSGRFQRANGTYGESLILSHRRQDFDVTDRNATNALLKWLEACTGCHTLGFFICNWQDFKRSNSWGKFGDHDYEKQDEMLKEYRKTGFTIMPNHPGYKEFYTIDTTPKSRKAVGFDDLDSNASLTRIKNAFMKSGSVKKTNRKIMVRFAEIFATNKG